MGKSVFLGVLVDGDKIVLVRKRLDTLFQEEQFGAPLELELLFATEGLERGTAEPFLAEFHLDEYDVVFLLCDDVDFASPNLPIGRDNPISGTFQIPDSDIFSSPTDGAGIFSVVCRCWFWNHRTGGNVNIFPGFHFFSKKNLRKI